MEIFKDIIGFEGMYQVSNHGRVKSLERPHNIKGIWKEKILKLRVNKKGYISVCLCKNNKKTFYRINRLVALHFLDFPENKKEVNHKNGDKLNNHVSNLEGATRSENEKHAFHTGLKNAKGENHPQVKLTNNHVKGIRVLLEAEWDIEEIAKIHKVTKEYVGQIKRGERRSQDGLLSFKGGV